MWEATFIGLNLATLLSVLDWGVFLNSVDLFLKRKRKNDKSHLDISRKHLVLRPSIKSKNKMSCVINNGSFLSHNIWHMMHGGSRRCRFPQYFDFCIASYYLAFGSGSTLLNSIYSNRSFYFQKILICFLLSAKDEIKTGFSFKAFLHLSETCLDVAQLNWFWPFLVSFQAQWALYYMLRSEPLLGALTISMHFCLKDVMPLLIACWPESNPDCSGGGSCSCVLATPKNMYQKTENGSHQFIIQCYAQRDFLFVCIMWCYAVLFSLLARVSLMDVDVFNAWDTAALIFYLYLFDNITFFTWSADL